MLGPAKADTPRERFGEVGVSVEAKEDGEELESHVTTL